MKQVPLALELERALRRALRTTAGTRLRVLPEGQLVIRKHMTANPRAREGVKAAPEIPGPDGFEIYISCRAPAAVGETAPAASLEPPLTRPAELQWTGQGGAGWRFAIPSGEEVRLRLAAGEDAPRDEIDRLLGSITGVLQGRIAGL